MYRMYYYNSTTWALCSLWYWSPYWYCKVICNSNTVATGNCSALRFPMTNTDHRSYSTVL